MNFQVCTPADWETSDIPMVDTSVSNCDINRLFRTGVITYTTPSGKSYMRTIGKQKIEESGEDEKGHNIYKNMFADVHEQGTD